MPGLQVGIYPGYDEGDAAEGTEVSSTYEGRHLTVLESEMIHPSRTSTYVNKGDPVLLCQTGVHATYGKAVGVAFNTATAATDFIAIDTEGIFNLQVFADDDNGTRAIEIGDDIYIRDGSAGATSGDGTGDAELSKRRNIATQRHFGYALGRMVAGHVGIIAVKVHMDPLDDEGILFGDINNPETGENGRLAYGAYVNFNGADEFLDIIQARAYWTGTLEEDAVGSCTAITGSTGVAAGSVLGGASAFWSYGVKGQAIVAGTLDNSGAHYLCGVQASRGGAGTFSDMNVLTALHVVNTIAADIRTETNIDALAFYENNGGLMTSIWRLNVQNVDYFFDMGPGPGDCAWGAGGTSCNTSGVTAPSGALRCRDFSGNDAYIRLWAIR